MLAYIHTFIQTYIVNMHTYIHGHKHTYIIHTYTHTYKHTYMHTYTHSCMHAHTYIHTHVRTAFVTPVVEHWLERSSSEELQVYERRVLQTSCTLSGVHPAYSNHWRRAILRSNTNYFAIDPQTKYISKKG